MNIHSKIVLETYRPYNIQGVQMNYMPSLHYAETIFKNGSETDVIDLFCTFVKY